MVGGRLQARPELGVALVLAAGIFAGSCELVGPQVICETDGPCAEAVAAAMGHVPKGGGTPARATVSDETCVPPDRQATHWVAAHDPSWLGFVRFEFVSLTAPRDDLCLAVIEGPEDHWQVVPLP